MIIFKIGSLSVEGSLVCVDKEGRIDSVVDTRNRVNEMEASRKIGPQPNRRLANLEAEALKLSEADFNDLLLVLENPPEPNEALKSGFRWYKSLVS